MWVIDDDGDVDVVLDEQQLRTQWPERAVPTAIVQGAQAMDTLHIF